MGKERRGKGGNGSSVSRECGSDLWILNSGTGTETETGIGPPHIPYFPHSPHRVGGGEKSDRPKAVVGDCDVMGVGPFDYFVVGLL